MASKGFFWRRQRTISCIHGKEKSRRRDHELKAIYHSKGTVCIRVFKVKEDSISFIDDIAGMPRNGREKYLESFYK